MATDSVNALQTDLAVADSERGEGDNFADAEISTYGAASSVQRPARDSSLPDLTERLKQQGIYGEYVQYRQKYHEWRKGGSKGATGELTSDTLADAKDPHNFEYWYPTASIFEWRFTTAYWVGVSFMVGSFIFSLTSGIAYYGGHGGALVHGPNSIGAFIYTLGTYFGYRQLINIGTKKEESTVFFTFKYEEIFARCPPSSIIGTLSYFIGAILCNIDAVAHFLMLCSVPLGTTYETRILGWPTTIGCSLFVIASIAEIEHNKILQSGGASWQEAVFWASLADMLGSWGFLLGAIPYTLPSSSYDDIANFSWMVGSMFFVVSSVMTLVMWEANDFGLTLLKQLNDAIRTHGAVAVSKTGHVETGNPGLFVRIPPAGDDPEIQDAQMSARGIAFIIIYCWLASVTITNCVVKHVWFLSRDGRLTIEFAMDMSLEIFVLCAVILVLVIHSVVTQVPDAQPYRCALLFTRAVMTFGAVMQTVGLAEFLRHPGSPSPSYNLLKMVLAEGPF